MHYPSPLQVTFMNVEGFHTRSFPNAHCHSVPCTALSSAHLNTHHDFFIEATAYLPIRSPQILHPHSFYHPSCCSHPRPGMEMRPASCLTINNVFDWSIQKLAAQICISVKQVRLVVVGQGFLGFYWEKQPIFESGISSHTVDNDGHWADHLPGTLRPPPTLRGPPVLTVQDKYTHGSAIDLPRTGSVYKWHTQLYHWSSPVDFN